MIPFIFVFIAVEEALALCDTRNLFNLFLVRRHNTSCVLQHRQLDTAGALCVSIVDQLIGAASRILDRAIFFKDRLV
jgi:hypothetical protein